MTFDSDANVHDGIPTPEVTIRRIIHDVRSQFGRVPEDLGTIKSLASTLLTKGVSDDRKYALEKTIQWACSFDKDSPASAILTDAMLANLWDNLKHPPLSYMGNDHRYRMADGSNNNILYPDLGKAGSNYARSVVPQRSLGPLPDPGDVFDQLFARRGVAKEHPTKFSSLAISLATIITHDIFRTDDRDPNKVATSSYLDLSPLYGCNEDAQKTVRTYKDGFLKPDTFAEPRVLSQPPGVGALLISFGRFHNYVVSQLAEINEGGRFSLQPSGATHRLSAEAAAAKRDNDLFQTGRLITCGLYINIILHDYVRVILNLNRTDTTWTLDPRSDAFNPFDSQGIPKGIGNQVSMEFNLIYRWHATVSNKNEAWTNDVFAKIFPGLDPATMTQQDLQTGFARWGRSVDQDPAKWEFGPLKRNAEGGFDDAALVTVLADTIEDVAGAFGARNVPVVLRSIEILGINQGRNWGTASLNEVRKFFKLKPHASFPEINPDPEIAASLEALYGHPDNVELYPGLVCEDTKPPAVPGSGLCAGLTVAKAILSDAVALVRGDRYYTVDNSPTNLTSFGFDEIASDGRVGFGTTIHKLLHRAYPGWFRSNSVYALFPLTIPPENRVILQDRGLEADYDYDRPQFVPPPTAVSTWKGVVDMLADQQNLKITPPSHVHDLIKHDRKLSGYKPSTSEQKAICIRALYDPAEGLDEILDYYDTVTNELIRIKSIKMRDHNQIDAVRDVGNTSHAIVIAHLFRIPLKEQGGSFTPTKLYEALINVHRYLFLDIDNTKSLEIKDAAKKAVASLAYEVARSCKSVKHGHNKLLASMFTRPGKDICLPQYGTQLVARLFDAGLSLDEVIWLIVSIVTEAGPTQSQAIAKLLDFYLSTEQASAWAAIQALSHSDSVDSLNKLRKYVLEGLRLTSPSAGVLRTVVNSDFTFDDGSEHRLRPEAGSILFADFASAGRDPNAFPEPLMINVDRPDEKYTHFGHGVHACLGRDITELSLAVQLRAFARLPNLRRVAGPAGMLKATHVNGAFSVYMNEYWSSWTPFPSGMKLYYDP
ncbi:heme peroxidase [Myriangium duriaei CBS 260.36]|uniref:linoleate 8R-lipoxygenase n=1 Tax=Myriangium duriaei CBS 260.36 TaxID=1168546 RepID=A0A9P4IZ01_9PEZI|nr:heme peroxidase [Myriangium duriaei CBS 260.36]